MLAFVRPYATAGVALVGAAAVAVAPVMTPPSLPDIEVAATQSTSPEVHLAALANPLEVYGALVEETLANLTLIGERIAADPAPVLQQLIANQLASAEILGDALQQSAGMLAESLTNQLPALLEVAFNQLLDGNIEGAINGLWQATITPLISPAVLLIPAVHQVIRQPVQNMLNVVDAVQAPILFLAIGALSPVYAGVVKTGGAFVQDVFDAVTTADLEALANAFITGPAGMIGGLLNGDGVDAGLLSPGLGLAHGLLGLRDAIADALGANSTVGTAADEIASVAVDAGDSVTLDVAAPTAGVQRMSVTSTQGGEPTTEEAVDTDVKSTDDGPEGLAEETAGSDEAAPAAIEDGLRRDSLKAVPGTAVTGLTKTTERNGPVRGVRSQARNAATSVESGVRGGIATKRAGATGSDSSASSGGRTESNSGANSSDD
ncbi:hypothetical protein [Mycolicibacterium thermoresistibile]